MDASDMTIEDIDLFIAHIDRSGGPRSCHVWTGPTFSDGYGFFTKWGPSHRITYELKNGPIPEGVVVRHKCDNPACCNPTHLEIGSHADNRADCVERRRHARGPKHGHSKLTASQVRFIRTHHKGWTHAQIAEKYGVSRSTITKIRNGSTYSGIGKSGSMN